VLRYNNYCSVFPGCRRYLLMSTALDDLQNGNNVRPDFSAEWHNGCAGWITSGNKGLPQSLLRLDSTVV